MIEASEFGRFIPHKGNMLWIDYLVKAQGEDSGRCLVELNQQNHYFQQGHFKRLALIEFIAQSYAIVLAHSYKKNPSAKLKNAFIVGLESVEFQEGRFIHGKKLYIDTHVKNYLDSFRYIEGKVLSEDESQIYCKGIIKLFSNPPQ
jgi:predicted hotdog family 3-hydroxylacyl-ACP dehydratase